MNYSQILHLSATNLGRSLFKVRIMYEYIRFHLFSLINDVILSYGAAGMIRSIEESSDLIRNRTRDLPAYSIVPQSSTLPRAPKSVYIL
jgi:hypothetical protein